MGVDELKQPTYVMEFIEVVDDDAAADEVDDAADAIFEKEKRDREIRTAEAEGIVDSIL